MNPNRQIQNALLLVTPTPKIDTDALSLITDLFVKVPIELNCRGINFFKNQCFKETRCNMLLACF
jgi:hypothetical protein